MLKLLYKYQIFGMLYVRAYLYLCLRFRLVKIKTLSLS